MTKIIYKPHCGKCGFPIDTSEEEVAYQDVYDICSNKFGLNKKYTQIYILINAHIVVKFLKVLR